MENNRKSQRRRSILVGSLLEDDGSSVRCMIADMSTSGARVKTSAEISLGTELYLKIDKFNDLRRAEVVWLREGYTGLRFSKEITNPPASMAAFLAPIAD